MADASLAPVQHFASFDGVRLAYGRMGQGRPLILLHGLFSNHVMNWVKFGHAAHLASLGFDVIMPDLRAHGGSDAPHDAAHYPPDVLARDLEALVAHLQLRDFDVAGFSLGARTVAQALLRGLRPRRAALTGMGLEGLTHASRRQQFFLEAIAHEGQVKMGSPYWFAVQFMRTMKVDIVAAAHVVRTLTDVDPALLAQVDLPIAVICGDKDQDNGSAPALAAHLPQGRYMEITGDHVTSVSAAGLGLALGDFFTA